MLTQRGWMALARACLLAAATLLVSGCSFFYLHDPDQEVGKEQFVARAAQENAALAFSSGARSIDDGFKRRAELAYDDCLSLNRKRMYASQTGTVLTVASMAAIAAVSLVDDPTHETIAVGTTAGMTSGALGGWLLSNYYTNSYNDLECAGVADSDELPPIWLRSTSDLE